ELPSPKDPPSKLIHGDIQENHILLPKGGRQIGVIDFDLRLGDPAWDFGALWAWGDWAPRFVFQHYAFAAEDPDLLERSRLQSVRYWVERLYWRIQGADTHLGVAEVAEHAMTQLAMIGTTAPVNAQNATP